MEIVIALAVGAAIFAGSVVVVRMIARGPGPDPNPEDVIEVESEYRCTVCGMRLTVTHRQDADHDAPRHCREEMDLIG